ncbi:MAG: DUF1059 domain-containing protein [Acidimicrobiia bacterium]|nr:DUF1059 domain-containing protein [Acidimicrobiia bacterium]
MQRRLTCACGWQTEGEFDDLVDQATAHGREIHNMEVTREQVLEMTEPIES